ncbi:hypothetical protein E4L98_03455 [Duganella callida]|uniref:Uncharacterized protein n=2 Tax=Duganella callida TaxID=2561932 RepID=A0A4Y9SW62_9BURK|nr:hypothetical protein E4L98_03455 [Duganella callida]
MQKGNSRQHHAPQPPTPQPITPHSDIAEPPPQAISRNAPADPFAAPAKPELTLKERALLGAAKADQQLRKEAWTQRDRKYVNDESALATALGKAWQGGEVQTVEMVGADGSRITKWIMPGGKAVCYYAAPNTFSGGRDPFRDSGRLSVRACP